MRLLTLALVLQRSVGWVLAPKLLVLHRLEHRLVDIMS
jgi:hypothetical protein